MTAGGPSHFVDAFSGANHPLGHTVRHMPAGGPSHCVGPFFSGANASRRHVPHGV
ncbi:hypothetical protein [Candidatus Cryptobacteroides sp.]|uniref:hypothetical protein n=1 Tax=Candidatus Cryptobacteroides sp. TaxID=2952915 RepID=UPI002A7ED114|nr:hypothetical protein [Candidatus Cryptobacteroides sp.]MDY3879298.1 hypothetical protein [Candidatus Cryptobacteroides sp.]